MVYLDTNILIYLLERHTAYSNLVADALDELRSQKHSFLTSVITTVEFFASTKASDPATLQRVPGLNFVALDATCAQRAASLQRNQKLQIGDAIQLATAIEQRTDLFFTNDDKLSKIAQKYLPVKSVTPK